MIWLGLLIFGVTMVGRLVYDVGLYLSGKPNKHLAGPAITFVALVAASWLAGWISAPMFLFGFWAIFDPSYALLIGERWNWIGTTAKLDKLQRRYKWIIWAKYIGAVVFTLLFLLRNKIQFIG